MKHERTRMFLVLRKMVIMCWNKEKIGKLRIEWESRARSCAV